MVDEIEWKEIQEKALFLVTEGLMTPIENKEHFAREDIPSDEEFTELKSFIDMCEKDRMPLTYSSHILVIATTVSSWG